MITWPSWFVTWHITCENLWLLLIWMSGHRLCTWVRLPVRVNLCCASSAEILLKITMLVLITLAFSECFGRGSTTKQKKLLKLRFVRSHRHMTYRCSMIDLFCRYMANLQNCPNLWALNCHHYITTLHIIWTPLKLKGFYRKFLDGKYSATLWVPLHINITKHYRIHNPSMVA